MLGGRSFIFGVLYYTVISLAVILFASPLFAVIGFEFATIISLALSIHLLFFVAEKTAALPKGKFVQTVQSIYQPALIFTFIPFCLGVVTGLIRNQCDLLLGILMYLQVVIPTAIIAVLFGIHFGWMKERPLQRRLWVSAFWIVTFVISLAPGYLNPQIFTYGWQYGFFPGIIWDAAMELQPAYWWSRLFAISFAVGFIFDEYLFIKAGAITWKEKRKVREDNFWRAGWIIYFPLIIFPMLLPYFGITRSHDYITRELAKTIDVKSSVIIHCTDSTFTKDELTSLQYNCTLYCDSIRSFFHLKDKRLTHLYIYSSEEEMKKYVGTANASIAKPWMNELHIAKENLGSLKHELVHTLLAPYGNFPFDISWSTGLTEGAAVAVEENYDGLRDCDEYATRMLQLGLATGIQDIMSFSGFAAGASGKSYTLAGSFCKFLIKYYGSEKFLTLYHSRDYESVYQKTLGMLETEWRASLVPRQIPMDHYDSLRTRFYFDRTSIINEPCLRRIGRMMKEANDCFADSMYKEADALYDEVLHESDRLDAIRGRVFSHLRMNNPKGALTILDTLPAAKTELNRAALHNLRGDCILLATNDTTRAKIEWAEAMRLELSEKSVTSAYIRYHYLVQIEPWQRKYVYQYIYQDKDMQEYLLKIMQDGGLGFDNDFEVARSAFLFNVYQSQGRLDKSLYPAYIASAYYSKGPDSLSRSQFIVSKRLSMYFDKNERLFKE